LHSISLSRFGHILCVLRERECQCGPVLSHHFTDNNYQTDNGKDGSLHLLVPATSSNADLCKILLSASILGYPPAVLINWAAPEDADPYVQHLAKVWTILEYLDRLADSGKGDELVLIVDGFDVHFQLPPEVIISRYYQENARADKRVVDTVGEEMAAQYNMRQTVIFGHDKLCWPMDNRRPACWVVPEASDSRWVYGPYTDTQAAYARARWLNSGTVIGPVNDTRDVFRATLDLIHTKHTTDSDQFYFANLFGLQEFARKSVRTDEPFKDIKKSDVDWPVLEKGQRTEFFLGLDYEAIMFQTMAFFREYITWVQFDLPAPKPDTWSIDNVQQRIVQDDWLRSRHLPDDVTTLSRGPFDAFLPDANIPASKTSSAEELSEIKAKSIPIHESWDALKLGANIISNTIFPVLHFTGDKGFRDLWWPRMWYYPWGEQLLKAAVKRRLEEEEVYGRPSITSKTIGKKTWWFGEIVGTDVPDKVNWGTKGGAFGGNGTFLGWDQLCGMHEVSIFPQK